MAAAAAVDWQRGAGGGFDRRGGTVGIPKPVNLAAFGGFGYRWRCFSLLVLFAGTAVSQPGRWFAGGYWAGGVVERDGTFAGDGVLRVA